MNRQNQSLLMRAALFVFGMVILILAFVFLIPYASTDSQVRVFATIDAALLFTLVFGPVLLGGVFETLQSGRGVTPSIGFLGVGMWVYIPVSLVVIVLLVIQKDPPIPVLLIVQLAAVFLLALSVLVGGQVSEQVEAVNASEQATLSSVKQLRSSAEQLAVTVSSLPLPEGEESRQLVRDVKKLSEELSYVSPSTSSDVTSLENGIQTYISALSACLRADEVGPSQVQHASELVHDALALVERRKAIRN